MTSNEALRSCTLDELHVDDEPSMKAIPVYADLKTALLRAGHRFRVLAPGASVRWDRALLLNLTFWGGDGGDVLPEDRIAADVVAHVAWHHLAARALPKPLSVDALFLGEAIASAFDVYLVGRMLSTQRKRSPRSTFLETQVPAMAESASAAGLDERAFEELLGTLAAAPERSFEQLRSLLVDVTRGLYSCVDAAGGLAVLQAHEGHPFAPLLHRYELSNWVLWARAWAPERAAPDEAARAIDASLRAAPDALAWLTTMWMRG